MKLACVCRVAASVLSALVISGAFVLGVSGRVAVAQPAQPAGQPTGGAAPSAQSTEPTAAQPAPASVAQGEQPGQRATSTLDPSWISTLEWRSIGPANMGGRIVDIAVNEKDPTNFWVATASGGLLKTVNNGVTFEHQFDRESTVSIGSVAVAASDPNIIWVGTGENNPRNSVSWGDGVYKSTDGGKTWKNMGLRQSFQTGGLVIHPTDPNIVYVGAMGRCWGPSDERGLYKTTDGGETWSKALSIDDKTGVIELVMSPANPDTLLVATWERQRDGFDGNDPEKKWGPGSGLHKTTDGGATFRKITAGLPSNILGRIGLDYYRANPEIVYAIVDCEQIGSPNPNEPFFGITGENAEVGARLTRIVDDGPAAKAGLKTGDIVVNVNGNAVLTYQALLSEIRKFKPDDKVKVQASRDRELVDVEVTLAKRPEEPAPRPTPGGGNPLPSTTTPTRPYSAFLGGQRANIQDEQGENGHEYGGVYRSEDGGETWKRVNSLNPRPMYFSCIRVDPTDDKVVWVHGVSLHISRDAGKTFTDDAGRGTHADHHAMWINPANSRHVMLGNDGGFYMSYDQGKTWDHFNHVAIGQFYHVALDTRYAFNVYGGLQDNGSWGSPVRQRAGAGPVNVDWFRIGGGDGFLCAVDPEDPDQIYFSSQNGSTGWRNLKTGRQGSIRPPRDERPDGQPIRYRFNWETPYILSAHNPKMYYVAGNHVWRSFKGGQELWKISPEITRTDRGSATALAESPLDPRVIYAGTDDGALWGTRDGGHTWTSLIGLPPPPSESESEKPAGPIAANGSASPGVLGGQPSTPAPEPAEPRRGPRRSGAAFAEMIANADANGDGLIQKSEMPERMQFLFDRIDTDKSGGLDKAELDAFMARQGDRRGRQPQSGGNQDEPPAGGNAPPLEPHAQPARPGTPVQPPSGGDSPASNPPSTTPEQPAPAPTAEQPAASPAAPAAATDALSGRWKARIIADLPPSLGEFELTLKLAEGKITGDVRSERSTGTIESGSFDAATGDLKVTVTSELGQATITARVEGGKMTGSISMGGEFSAPFEAERAAAPAPSEATAAPQAEQPQGERDDRGERGRRGRRDEPIYPPGKPLHELVKGPRWVASLEASRFEARRVYLALDGHRSDDDEPYLFVSEDHGATWRSIVSNLPRQTTRVLREDITSPEILYCGTEFGCYVSLNRGGDWTKLNGSLPTVAVHDFAQHPRTGEIVAATHGRSLWVLDATPLRQFNKEALAAPVTLYKPSEARVWRTMPSRGISGARHFVGQNPPSAAQLYYSLAEPAKEVSIKVLNQDGTQVRGLILDQKEVTTAGLHRVSWDLRRDPPPRGQGGGPGVQGGGPGGAFGERAGAAGPGEQAGGGAPGGPAGGPARAVRPGAESEGEPGAPAPGSRRPGGAGPPGAAPATAPGGAAAPGAAGAGGPGGGGFGGGGGGGGFGGGGFGGRFGAPRVAAGTYIVVLTVDGKEFRQPITVSADPDYPDSIAAEEDEELQEPDEEEPAAEPVIR